MAGRWNTLSLALYFLMLQQDLSQRDRESRKIWGSAVCTSYFPNQRLVCAYYFTSYIKQDSYRLIILNSFSHRREHKPLTTSTKEQFACAPHVFHLDRSPKAY
jgi:hypothetical protein